MPSCESRTSSRPLSESSRWLRYAGMAVFLGSVMLGVSRKASAATITVTSLADNATVDGQVTLREAIQAANTDTSVDGSTAGSGADTIVFAPGLTGSIDLITAGDTVAGSSALGITSDITIDGANGGAAITIARPNSAPNMRLFRVAVGASLKLDGVTISGGYARGGNGGISYQGGGGGGGAGLGGAIFNQGTLTIENSTVTGNTAQGGNSAQYYNLAGGGGGGGGLGGSGGAGGLNGGVGGGPNGGAAGTAGTFGGGGGGGNSGGGNAGGNGGFGAGGGGGGSDGNGGFGGFGGGAGGGGYPSGAGGTPGFAGGSSNAPSGGQFGGFGGGGAGLGGAIFNYGGTVTVTNSTFTGNTAHEGLSSGGPPGSYGGAIFSRNGTLTLTNCTISSNTANAGKGITVLGDGATANASLTNTLIGQTDATLLDAYAATRNGGGLNLTGAGNLIRNHAGGFNGVVSAADPLLPALADNGGMTKTMLPPANSPAVDAGVSVAPTTDQRGAARLAGLATDIGAVEHDVTAPTAGLTTAPNVTDASNPTLYTFTITFSDNFAVNSASLGNTDVRVDGPNGFSQAAQFVSATPAGNGTPRIATYSITPPGGSWDRADNGTYSIVLLANQVSDLDGNAVAAATLGTFGVNVPDVTPPTASLSSAPDVTASSDPAKYELTITFADNFMLNAASLGDTNVRVDGPNGFTQAAKFVSATPAGNGPQQVATYSITPPGGSWDALDRGTYSIVMLANQVSDVDGNVVAAATLGSFNVTIPSPPAASGDTDFDGDGFSDELEAALGSVYDDPHSTPFPSGQQAGQAQSIDLSGSKLKIALAFAGKDSISAAGAMSIPAGVPLSGSTITFDIGGVIQPFTLDAKGKAQKTVGTTDFKLSMRAKGKTGEPQTATFALKIAGTDLESKFSDEGLTSTVVKKAPVTVVVTILFNATLYRQSVPLSYTSDGKKGRTAARK
jgi:CSLREA domain-containing protein